MARADVLKVLYAKNMTPMEFNFETLMIPSMYNYLTPWDIDQLHEIATSARYGSRMKVKYKAIDEIMSRRGFFKFRAGTNRVIYRHLEDPRFVAKIAVDKVGMSDNPNEFRNQTLLKPFVTKVFEVSPCGTVAFVERVEPINNREEFLNIADSVFEVLTNCILGLHALDDIGTDFFMNWGVRVGFGPVLLDFPYVFEIDGNKLHCNLPEVDLNGVMTGKVCDGEIDYDAGFNYLVCEKCGKQYSARDLRKAADNNEIMLRGGRNNMSIKVLIKEGDKVIGGGLQRSSNVIRKPQSPRAQKYDIKAPKKLAVKVVQSETNISEDKPKMVSKEDTQKMTHHFAKVIPTLTDDVPGDESKYKDLEPAIYSIKSKDTAHKVLKFLETTIFKEIINDYKDGIVRFDPDETDIKIKDTFNFNDKEGLRGSLFIKNNGSLLIKITGAEEPVLIKGHVFDLVPEEDRLVESDEEEDEEDEDEDEDTSSEEEVTEEATEDTTEAAEEPTVETPTAPAFNPITIPMQQLKQMLISELDQDTYDRCQVIQSYYSTDHDMVVTIAKTEQGTNVIDKIVSHGSFDEVFEKFMTEFAEYGDRRDELCESLKLNLTNPNLAAEYDTALQGACKAEVPEESSEDRIQRTNRHLGRKKPDDDTLDNF